MTLIIFVTIFTMGLLSTLLVGVELWTAIVIAALSALMWSLLITQIVGMFIY